MPSPLFAGGGVPKLNPVPFDDEDDAAASASGVFGGLPNPNPTGFPMLPPPFPKPPKAPGLVAPKDPLNGLGGGVGLLSEALPNAPPELKILLPKTLGLLEAAMSGLGFSSAGVGEPKTLLVKAPFEAAVEVDLEPKGEVEASKGLEPKAGGGLEVEVSVGGKVGVELEPNVEGLDGDEEPDAPKRKGLGADAEVAGAPKVKPEDDWLELVESILGVKPPVAGEDELEEDEGPPNPEKLDGGAGIEAGGFGAAAGFTVTLLETDDAPNKVELVAGLLGCSPVLPSNSFSTFNRKLL